MEMKSVRIQDAAMPFKSVYIPHHAVVQDSSSTTMLRVVFNALCKIRNSTPLNDHMLVGPTLQQDFS